MEIEVEKILKALSDKNRLRILKMLECRNLCVCEITQVLGIRQPSVSRHLKKLKGTGIIGERQDGFFTEYYLIRKGLWWDIWNILRRYLEGEKIIEEDEEKTKVVSRYRR
jgi:DNA-binding transcriptional ArsR family regulator